MPNVNDDNIHANHRERMRQRIEKDGAQSLHDHELLEYLLYAYIPRKDTNPIAHKLLNLCGSLDGVFNSPVEFLTSIPNMTKSAALFLSSMRDVIKRCENERGGKRDITLSSIAQAKDFFQELFGDALQEQLYVAQIASSGLLVDLVKVGNGTTNECKLDIKKLILKMAGSAAAEVIIAHNHPSGNSSPSMNDYTFTKWAFSFFASMGMKLVDHIVVSRYDSYSFREHGVIDRCSDEYDKYCGVALPDKSEK